MLDSEFEPAGGKTYSSSSAANEDFGVDNAKDNIFSAENTHSSSAHITEEAGTVESVAVDYVEGEDVVYTTGEVAEMLGITRDRLRYHIKDFEDYIQIDKTKSGKGAHWRFHAKDVEVIRTIIRLKDSGKSVEDIKDMLDNLGMDMMVNDASKMVQVFTQVLNRNNEMLLDKFKDIMDLQNKQNNMNLLEMADREKVLVGENENLRKQVGELSQQVQTLSELIDERLPEKKGLFGFLKK